MKRLILLFALAGTAAMVERRGGDRAHRARRRRHVVVKTRQT